MLESKFDFIKLGKVVSMFVLAIAGIAYSYQYGRWVNQSYPSRTFTVDGEAEMSIQPDIATFQVSVVTEGGTSVAEVQRGNSAKMDAVVAYLKEMGIDSKDLKTTEYNLMPRYTSSACVAGRCPAPTIEGYSLTQSLTVKVRDVEKLGELLSGAVERGGNSVSSVQFTVDDEDEARAKARTEAIDKAQAKAKSIAKAGGFGIGRLVSIYEDNSPIMPSGLGMGGAMEKSAYAPSIEPGTEDKRVRVTLTYEILN